MATITDIAKMAGVSTSTVSHVVNKTRFVSPELVERVEKAIQELDHPPNFVIKKNKSLTQSKADTKYILFLKSNRKSNFQQQIEKQAETLLKNTPYTLLSFEYAYDPNRLDIINRYLTNAPEAAGAIVFPDEEDTILESFLNLVNFPVVILGREL
ncbi:LacI family DNA-binding transcriptional regulator, partial [Robinsoniella sp.]